MLSTLTLCSNTLERISEIKIKVRWLFSSDFIPLPPKKCGEIPSISWKQLQFPDHAFIDKVTFPVVIRTGCAIQRFYLHAFYGDQTFFLTIIPKHSLNAVRHCREWLHRKKKTLGNFLSRCTIVHTVSYRGKLTLYKHLGTSSTCTVIKKAHNALSLPCNHKEIVNYLCWMELSQTWNFYVVFFRQDHPPEGLIDIWALLGYVRVGLILQHSVYIRPT